MQEIILRYFSPSTILFTAIPLLIFISTRKIISTYIHILFPSIDIEKAGQFLSECAFSFPNRHTDINENILKKHPENQAYTNILGGPAHFTCDSLSMFIIQNIKNSELYLHSSENKGVEIKRFLSHGEKIYAVITNSDRNMTLKNMQIKGNHGQVIHFDIISLSFKTNASQQESALLVSNKIMMPDAKFLSCLGSTDKNSIHQFLYSETKNFLERNSSIIFDDLSFPTPIPPAMSHALNNSFS